MIEDTATQITALVQQLDDLIDSNDGHRLSTQAAKLALLLENVLEHKANAKRLKLASYAKSYEIQRRQLSQGDAKIAAEPLRDFTYDQIEALESGIKSVLSTIKDKLHWLELENQRKSF